jgi:hypothetical protein
MRCSCEKTATYNNASMLCGSAKPTLHLSKTPRARIHPTRIRLVAAHATLAHATLSSRGTARLWERRASCDDRLASSLRSHSVEESVRSRVFAGEADEEG